MSQVLEETAVRTPTAQSAQPVVRRHWFTRFVAWLGGGLPTLLVIAALAGIAYWGHHTGWKLPKFSELNGTAHVQADDWCEEHGVPDSVCVACQPDLLPQQDEGWCKEHGVHNCVLCHPELAQLDYFPIVAPADLKRVKNALVTVDRSQNNSKCQLYLRRIQFASIEAMQKAGVDVAIAERRPMTEFLVTSAEVSYDHTRVAHLSSPAAGTVWRVEKEVGQSVQQGDVLALVDAAEVGKAKAALLEALVQVKSLRQNVEALQALAGSGAVSGRKLRDTETALGEAKIRLLGAKQSLVNLGLPVPAEHLETLSDDEVATAIQFLAVPDEIAESLDPATTTSNLLPLRAPFAGVVVEREPVAGEVVDSATTLFVVVDPTRMWLTLNVRQEDVRYLKLEQSVRFRADGGKLEAVGPIAWISPAVDETTRTVAIRVELPNPDGTLRANAFGQGRIVLREEAEAVVVPNIAVHWDGSCHVVFVRDKHFFEEGAPKVFYTRTVRLGASDEKYTELIAGVLPGEIVASMGSAVLRAELLRNNLGAG